MASQWQEFFRRANHRTGQPALGARALIAPDEMRVVDVLAIPRQQEIHRVNGGESDVRRIRRGVRGDDLRAE